MCRDGTSPPPSDGAVRFGGLEVSEGRPCYRAYRLEAGGRIADVDVIDASDDAEALAAVRAMASGHGIELWDRDRPVGRTEPQEGSGRN